LIVFLSSRISPLHVRHRSSSTVRPLRLCRRPLPIKPRTGLVRLPAIEFTLSVSGRSFHVQTHLFRPHKSFDPPSSLRYPTSTAHAGNFGRRRPQQARSPMYLIGVFWKVREFSTPSSPFTSNRNPAPRQSPVRRPAVLTSAILRIAPVRFEA